MMHLPITIPRGAAHFTIALAATLLGAVAAMPAPAAAAAEPCAGFSWEVARERALFAGEGARLAAGTDSGSAPRLEIARLYALQLRPSNEVRFVTTPGGRHSAEGGFAGLATLKITTPGTYRISVDSGVWIDVVADGGLLDVKDFQGAHDCTRPRKILEFDFPVPRQVMLQISAAGNA
ncbi:MAG TPA: hypothetical protein VGL50_04130, partial [Steroidobacteraceae bacterium]